jgi:hypothetical protein
LEQRDWAKWHFVEQAFLNETRAVMDMYANRLNTEGYRFSEPTLGRGKRDGTNYWSEVRLSINRISDNNLADHLEFFVIWDDRPNCTVVEARGWLLSEIERFLLDPASRFDRAH